MKKTASIVLLMLMVVTATCTRYSGDPELRAARDFIANYYILADQRRALPYTTSKAKSELENEIKLLESLAQRQDDYRSRDVTFELKHERRDAKRATFLFLLSIGIPGFEDRTQMISIIVERQELKVSHFGNVADDK